MNADAGERDAGTTLLEMMITLAVMSIATAIIAATLILIQRATNQIEASSSAIDSARLVSESLDRELRSADCISSPGENEFSSTLTFRTTLTAAGPVMLTYQVEYGTATQNGTVTRTAGAGQPRTVITAVGPPATGTSRPFNQVNTPLRTLVIDIPIRSANDGVFHLVTTIAGRNSWRPCT